MNEIVIWLTILTIFFALFSSIIVKRDTEFYVEWFEVGKYSSFFNFGVDLLTIIMFKNVQFTNSTSNSDDNMNNTMSRLQHNENYSGTPCDRIYNDSAQENTTDMSQTTMATTSTSNELQML